MNNLQIIAEAFDWKIEKINNSYLVFDEKDKVVKSLDCLYAVSRLFYRKIKQMNLGNKDE